MVTHFRRALVGTLLCLPFLLTGLPANSQDTKSPQIVGVWHGIFTIAFARGHSRFPDAFKSVEMELDVYRQEDKLIWAENRWRRDSDADWTRESATGSFRLDEPNALMITEGGPTPQEGQSGLFVGSVKGNSLYLTYAGIGGGASFSVKLKRKAMLGHVAVGATRSYLEHQRSLMVTGVKEEKPASTLVVANQAMRFGALLEPSVLKEIQWASEDIPEGAFRRIRDVLPDDQKRYVLSAVSPNEPILAAGITEPGQRATLSVTLEEGKRAVTMRVNDVLGVVRFVLPGNKVDVMLTRSKDGSPYVDVLLQGLKVLAIDQRSNEQADRAVFSRLVTFEVDTEQAQKLALGAQVGQLSLALRNVGDDAEEAVRRITIDDLAPPKIQSKPETPAASNARAPASVETVPRSHRPEREEADAAQYAEILARIAKLERQIQDLKALLTSDR